MKKLMIVGAVLLAFTFSYARPLVHTGVQGAKGPIVGIFSSTGGPDEYGYTWIDNDTTGGPVFNWVDITSIGTKVEGLSDDNVVGPFPIGFEFPYYWYKVDKFWICSNGVISFASGDLWTPHQGGSMIPSPSAPNDVVAPLGGDLNLDGDQGEVYYYSNGVDSLIVSFIDVPEWPMGSNFYGSHTFQLILNKNDSTITFQYGPQDGTFNYGGGASPAVGIGIENITGQVGLQYLLDNNPSENMYHDSLAILFMPPESTTYQVTDIAVVEAMNTANQGLFIVQNQEFTPYVLVKNSGTQEISSYTATLMITYFGADTPLVYTDTVSGGPIASGMIDTLDFQAWTPSDEGAYLVEALVNTENDAIPSNNYISVDLRVVGGHATLHFLNDTFTVYLNHWLGAGGGFGQKFTPPAYPCQIETVYVMLGVSSQSTPDSGFLYLYDDDGEGGLPGTVLASASYYVDSLMWYTIIPESPVVIEDGSFYVGFFQGGDDGPDFVLDMAPPISRLLYEYTGAWAPSRDKESADGVIKVVVFMPSDVSEHTTLGSTTFDLLGVNPSIATSKTQVEFSSNTRGVVKILLYDITGRTVFEKNVMVVGPGIHNSLLDLSNLKNGVYFLKLRKSGRESSALPVLRIGTD